VYVVIGVVAVALVSVGLTYRVLRDRMIVAESDRAIASAVAPPPGAPMTKSDALASVNVIVYTTSWCPHCKRAKAWMNANGIRYEDRDVDRSREYAAQLKAINGRGSIPTFDVEGQIAVGFSEQEVLAMRERAAAKKAVR